MLKTPVIIINFKTYRSATGERALKLAKICEKVANEAKASIAVAVQASDIYRVSQEVSIPVLAEHIDDAEYGSHTGRILAEDVKENGAAGTLLNHSERRLRIDILEKSIERAKEAGLVVVACANDADTGKAISAYDVDFIAVEPPELIGGDISVSSAEPELITESVEKICGKQKCSKVLVGAGVKSGEDVRTALKLGAAGVLVASGITKADDPEKALKELVSGLK
jgi:triosephosphate isomerase